MLESIQVVGGSVLTLFLLMAVGFFMGKKALLSPQALSQLSTLLLYIVCPIIMINTFLQQDHTSRTVRMLLVAGMVMVGTYVLNMILIPIFFRRTPRAERGVMQFSAIYGNIGFMGIPLISAVLGPEGMLVTVTGLAMFNISVWTHGAFLMGGRAEVSLKKALLNPGTIGFLVAIVLFGLHVELPGPVTDALGYIGDLNTPLAMVVVGAQMAAVDLPALFRDRLRTGPGDLYRGGHPLRLPGGGHRQPVLPADRKGHRTGGPVHHPVHPAVYCDASADGHGGGAAALRGSEKNGSLHSGLFQGMLKINLKVCHNMDIFLLYALYCKNGWPQFRGVRTERQIP